MRHIIFLALSGMLLAAPIEKTIDELLDTKQRTELKIPKYDPFKRAKPHLKKKTKQGPSLRVSSPVHLSAIMNSKAFFAGKWHKLGEYSSEGKLIKITSNSVYLRKGTKTKILRLPKHKKMFKIYEKDLK